MSEVARVDLSTGEIVEYDESGLPADPTQMSADALARACREVYERRSEIVGAATLESAQESLRRALAIERYLSNKQHKDEARRAARVLEAAVGEALGPSERTPGPGRGNKKTIDRDQPFLRPDEASRFRLMAEYKEAWWPVLDEKALSRKHVLNIIDEVRRPKKTGEGSAHIWAGEARSWLHMVTDADLLLTDPPYSTDVADIQEFVASWFPKALSTLKPSGRAFVFIGAYADELAAYFSTTLPDGWEWGVPHAWVYRNTIGPTPEYDFVRNWQCILTVRGPDADALHTDRITELLAGFVENAPDGRHEYKHHRWQKPLNLVRRLIRVSTEPGDTVVDPFAGSGTTLIAAKEEARHGIGCDVDPEAVAAAMARGCDAG